MRLQKFLSRAGVASRRKSEELIVAGRVRVNGEVESELGSRVDPEKDRVEFDGERVSLDPPLWIALHKPPGYVSTRDDPRGRRTVYDILPEGHHSLFHVGRLDMPSEGLILFTNQGDVANRLLHPRYQVDRVYGVVLDGGVSDGELRRIREGIELEDGLARAYRTRRVEEKVAGRSRVELTMREGRKREVRRLFEALGYEVRRLIRLRYGPVRLAGLARGEWRVLERDEVKALNQVGA